MFGRGTSPNENNYRGIVNGRIQIIEKDGYSAGVSIEAKGVPKTIDANSNQRGAISLCTDEILVASSANPKSPDETVRGPVTITVVTGLRFEDDGQGNTSLKMKTQDLTYRVGLLMSIGQGQEKTVGNQW
jgi:hypothetical protein